MLNMLVQLLYISSHNNVLPQVTEVKDYMKNVVTDKNIKRELSSILLASDKYYIQLIEGNREPVNRLYNRIVFDARHNNVTLLRYVSVKSREFGAWPAAYVDIAEFNVGSFNLLTPTNDIDISTISSAQAVTIVRRIYAHLQVRNQ